MASAAQAARISMAFGDGSNEVTMSPSDTVRVDIIWTMGALDAGKVPPRLTGLDLRFNVDDPPTGVVPTYGGEFPGGGKFTVTEVSTTQASWNLSATTGVGVPGGFSDGGFFLSGGDPAGVGGVVGNGTVFSTTVLSFVIHQSNNEGDTYISFRHLFAADPLPAAYNGAANWTLRFNGYTVGAAQQFDIGQGNPSDNGPAWAPFNGYEPFLPLVIHKVPEPGTLALLALGGLVALRRRS
jgi:hypothetical protein